MGNATSVRTSTQTPCSCVWELEPYQKMRVRSSLTIELMVLYVSNNNRGLKLLLLVRWAPSALDGGASEHKGKNCEKVRCRRMLSRDCLSKHTAAN